MNNGVYFSIMDVARFDMLVRNGVCAMMRDKGWYPVVASETITFRKSLSLWHRFTIESKLVGHDDKAVYMEQRFVRPGADGEPEIYAAGLHPRAVPAQGGRHRADVGDHRGARRHRRPRHPRVDRAVGRGCRAARHARGGAVDLD